MQGATPSRLCGGLRLDPLDPVEMGRNAHDLEWIEQGLQDGTLKTRSSEIH